MDLHKNLRVTLSLALAFASASHAQLDIRQHSVVSVQYTDTQYVDVTDTIDEHSGFELVSREHSVSYEDPFFDFDPTASSRFSVDSIDLLQTLPNGQSVIQVDISGQVYRNGPDNTGYFRSADAMSSIEVEFDIGLVSVSWEASYVSTQLHLGAGSQPYAASVNQVAPFDSFLLGLPVDGQSNSVTGTTGAPGVTRIARIDALADLETVLITHEGETTVNYSVSVVGVVSQIPSPGTVAVTVLSGLIASRRRR